VDLTKDLGRNASLDAMRRENAEPDALRQDKKSLWYQGNCQYCKTDFKKMTSWQKFCCEDCRKAAYELRTGKAWRGKKIATER
jgi:hypothetical protein